MGELLDYFKNRYGNKKNNVSEDKVSKTEVKNAISNLCDEYLEDADYILEFEVLPHELPYAVVVIDEEPLKSRYVINQISKTMFQATLRKVEL